MKTISKKMMLAGLLAVAALAPKEAGAFSFSNVFAVATKKLCETFFATNATAVDCFLKPIFLELQKVALEAEVRFLTAGKSIKANNDIFQSNRRLGEKLTIVKELSPSDRLEMEKKLAITASSGFPDKKHERLFYGFLGSAQKFCNDCPNQCQSFKRFDKHLKAFPIMFFDLETFDSSIKESAAFLKELNDKKKQ